MECLPENNNNYSVKAPVKPKKRKYEFFIFNSLEHFKTVTLRRWV